MGKRGGAALLAALCLLGGVAGAESIGEEAEARRMMTLSGEVVAGETKAVLAPFGGAVNEVSLQAGDLVAPGETLFTIETTKVYAPFDGTVGSVGAKVGDEASFIQEQYGALIYINPKSQFVIETDTKSAYNENENKIIRVGETVYIGSRNSNDRHGVGFVTAVDGENFTVEVTEGNLILDDGVSIYRRSDFAPSSRIGSGTTTLRPTVPITAEGSVFALHVAQGDEVKRGDLLAEMVTGSNAYNPFPTNKVVSGYAAIVASVEVTAGKTVSHGELLATLYPIDGLQIAVPITEWDLKNIQVGDGVRIELASFYGGEPLEGTVTSISGLSSGENEVEYVANISFEATADVRIGMTANVYINE